MRKMLILMLVLGMASLCPATQQWTITGSTATQTGNPGWEVNPSDTLTAVLNLTGAGFDIMGTGIIIDYVTDSGKAGAFTGCAVSATFDTGTGPGMTGAALDALLAGYQMPPSGIAANDWTWINMVSGTGNVTESALMTLFYTVGSTDSGLVSLTAQKYADTSSWANNSDIVGIASGNLVMLPIDLNVIPEPATIALLCLGGLLLKRKK